MGRPRRGRQSILKACRERACPSCRKSSWSVTRKTTAPICPAGARDSRCARRFARSRATNSTRGWRPATGARGRSSTTRRARPAQPAEPIRVDVHGFAPSRSQRRAQAKAAPAVTVRIGPVEVDEARLALYRAHESGRGLDRDGRPGIDTIGYESAFAMSCVEGFELRYVVAGQLAGVAITDRGARALSAVYHSGIRRTRRCRSGPSRSSRRSRSPGAGGSTGSTWVWRSATTARWPTSWRSCRTNDASAARGSGSRAPPTASAEAEMREEQQALLWSRLRPRCS